MEWCPEVMLSVTMELGGELQPREGGLLAGEEAQGSVVCASREPGLQHTATHAEL